MGTFLYQDDILLRNRWVVKLKSLGSISLVGLTKPYLSACSESTVLHYFFNSQTNRSLFCMQYLAPQSFTNLRVCISVEAHWTALHAHWVFACNQWLLYDPSDRDNDFSATARSLLPHLLVSLSVAKLWLLYLRPSKGACPSTQVLEVSWRWRTMVALPSLNTSLQVILSQAFLQYSDPCWRTKFMRNTVKPIRKVMIT